MAKVHSIHISDASMRPMRSAESAKLIAGKGIEGDRYATGEGTYVAFREPGRQLTLISKESAESHLAGLARGKVTVGNLRRNVVVSGMTASDLEDAIGSVLTLGDACRVRIHSLCVPCMYNEKLNQAPGLMEASGPRLGSTARSSPVVHSGPGTSLQLNKTASTRHPSTTAAKRPRFTNGRAFGRRTRSSRSGRCRWVSRVSIA